MTPDLCWNTKPGKARNLNAVEYLGTKDILARRWIPTLCVRQQAEHERMVRFNGRSVKEYSFSWALQGWRLERPKLSCEASA